MKRQIDVIKVWYLTYILYLLRNRSQRWKARLSSIEFTCLQLCNIAMTAKQSQNFIRCISAEADLITADIFWLTASMFSSRKRCEAVSQLLMVLLSHLLMVLLSFTTRVRQNGKNRPTTPWEYLNAWITNSLLMQWSVPCRSHTKIPPSLECCIDYTLATRESIDHMNVLLNWMSYRPGNNTLFDSVQ